MLAWIKKGFSTDNGEMDDARVAAFLFVLSFIAMAVYGVLSTTAPTLAEFGQFLEHFGIGAAAMAGGIGVWFGARKNN